MCFRKPLPLANHRLKSVCNFRKHVRPVMVNHDKQEVLQDFAPANPRGNFLCNGMRFLDRHRRALQKIPQFRRFRISAGEFVQLLLHRIRRALLQRHISQCVRVLEARRLQFGLPSSDLTNPLTSDSCACAVNCFVSSDSAPSTASFATSAFNSTRAARSAASISAFAATEIFSASDLAISRMRSASATASFCACARNSATSCSSRPSRASASASCLSASALTAVAFVIAELIVSAFARNFEGNTFPNNHKITSAKIAKLIHLNISVACSVALFASSEAQASEAQSKNTPHTLIVRKMIRRRFIASRSERKFLVPAWRFRRPVAEHQLPVRALPQQLLWQPVSWPRSLPSQPGSAKLSAGPPALRAVSSVQPPARHTPSRVPAS